MWLLLIKCSLYDFCNTNLSAVCLRGRIHNIDIPVLKLYLCWGQTDYWYNLYCKNHIDYILSTITT